MKDLLNDEFYNKAIAQLIDVANNMSNEVVGVIADRLKKIGEMNASDVIRLKNVMRVADLKKIEKAIADQVGVGVTEIHKIFEEVAAENDMMAKILYEYKGIDQVPFFEHGVISKIVNSATKQATKDFLGLSQTTTMGLMVGDTVLPLKKAYNKAIDNASFAVNQGAVDYNTAIRKTIAQLAKGGARVIYESGHTRRLDSAVRMNVLDGCRQMNLSMREQQAKEFGADGWEISAHPFSRPEHQSYQGKVFSLKEFEILNESLETPIATGEMNCRHTKVGIIMAINEPAYSKDELQKLNNNANEQVIFKGLSGKEMTRTRYDCTQYMRALETRARGYKDATEVFKRTGDKVAQKRYEREYIQAVKDYKRISKAVGIPISINRI